MGKTVLILVSIISCLAIDLTSANLLKAILPCRQRKDVDANFRKLKITLPNPSPAHILRDREFFFADIPLNQSQAESQGWTSLTHSDSNCTNNGRYNGFRFLPPKAPAVAVIYDSEGVLSGLQMLLSREKLLSGGKNPYRFDSEPMFQREWIRGVDSLVLTAYFSDPASICSSTRKGDNLERDGYGNELYFQNGPSPDSNPITVPKDRTDAVAEGWNANKCLALNGFHNFFQTQSWQDSNCTTMRPAWLFYDKCEKLSGFGFTAPGTDDSPRFQHPPGSIVQFVLNEPGNTCAKRVADTIGFSNMNVYFTDPTSSDLVCPHLLV